MASQRDVKNKIASVKNIQKITRAMEMVAAARLRRAEQRITALRPYADALGRMTRQAAKAAGAEATPSATDSSRLRFWKTASLAPRRDNCCCLSCAPLSAWAASSSASPISAAVR